MELKASLPQAVLSTGSTIQIATKPFTAIPYYAWANRGKGEMRIWFTEMDIRKK